MHGVLFRSALVVAVSCCFSSMAHGGPVQIVSKDLDNFRLQSDEDWDASNCRYEVVNHPNLRFGFTVPMARNQCLFMLQWAMVKTFGKDRPNIASVRDIFISEIQLTHVSADGTQTDCHLIPRKAPYDVFNPQDFHNAVRFNHEKQDIELEPNFKKKLDSNAVIKCPKF
jgi:hypothetical protein